MRDRPLLTDEERETIAIGMAEAAKFVCILGVVCVWAMLTIMMGGR